VRKLVEGLGFATASPYDTLTQITQLFTDFDFILLGFGGIGMVIAVLGMFNTLTISLLERTKEVALMVTLGARKRDVRALFLNEAVFLAGVGGMIGIALAGLVGFTVNTLLSRLAHSRGVHGAVSIFYLPLWLIAVTLVFAVGTGLLVAIYPVNKAGKIDPVDILRRG
jgi:putative ABC transport system permease protein